MTRVAWSIAVLWLTQLAALHAADRFTGVYLSEFLALNQRGMLDEDGDSSGWIELHNAGTAPVNLAGWFLTDSPTNLTRWRFPGVVLLPEKFLLVFASAKDRSKELTHLHTNFKLDPQGSYLALVDPKGQVSSEFTPAKQTAGVSDGRVRGEPAGPMPAPGTGSRPR